MSGARVYQSESYTVRLRGETSLEVEGLPSGGPGSSWVWMVRRVPGPLNLNEEEYND